MYTRTFDRGRRPARAGVRPFTHLAGRKIWLSSPDRLCLSGSAATVSGPGAAHVLTASVTLFTCQRAWLPSRAAFWPAQGEPRILTFSQALSSRRRLGLALFFRVFLSPAGRRHPGRLTGEKKAGSTDRLHVPMARRLTHPLPQGTADRHKAIRQPTRQTANPTLRQINIHPVSGPVNWAAHESAGILKHLRKRG